MKFFLLSFALILSSVANAQSGDYGFLKAEDQKYFKNDSLEGKNKWERIDANVAEINRLHGMMAEMKIEIQKLKMEVEELKKKK